MDRAMTFHVARDLVLFFDRFTLSYRPIAWVAWRGRFIREIEIGEA